MKKVGCQKEHLTVHMRLCRSLFKEKVDFFSPTSYTWISAKKKKKKGFEASG